MSLLDRLNSRLKTLTESEVVEIKDIYNSNYDRQQAENLLFHTIAPLTDHARFTSSWSARGSQKPPAGFVPNGPSPTWTPEEVVYAMAGDPALIDQGRTPRHPAYGNMGGSVLYRLAKRIAKVYRRDNPDFVAELYNQGFIPLVRMMQPGFDEGRQPFISYVIKNVESAMLHGVGSNSGLDYLLGEKGEVFVTKDGKLRIRKKEGDVGLKKLTVIGLQGLAKLKDPNKVMDAINIISPKYREERSTDRDPGNIFAPYSADYYKVGVQYAKALESGNQEAIDAAFAAMDSLREKVERVAAFAPGASTGMGQAISTADRKSKIGVVSADAESGDDAKSTLGATLPGRSEEATMESKEPIQKVLEYGLRTDIKAVIKSLPPKMSAKVSDSLIEAGVDINDIGGKFTANEFRYVLRGLGSLLYSDYPGKDVVRSNLSVPRDTIPTGNAPRWWVPGEDTEIEPYMKDGVKTKWVSIWRRSGMSNMGPTEIAAEMASEVEEFETLGIKTVRKLKVSTDSKGNVKKETLSKVSVSNQYQAALAKVKAIARVFKSEIDDTVDEGLIKSVTGYDNSDRYVLSEAADLIVNILDRVLIEDVKNYFKVIV